MISARADASEAAILDRMVRPGAATLPREAARDFLAPDFDRADRDRMRELAAKARVGALTAEEDAEAGHYERIGHLRNIPQTEARRSLQGHRDGDGGPAQAR